jgi:hypothetical protein
MSTSPPAISARVALSISMLLAPSVLSGQPESYWRVQSGLAYATLEFPNAKTPGAIATLTIEYLPVAGSCRVTLGLAIMKGPKLGTALSNGRASGTMTASVVGSKTWTDRPVVVKYSNGVESGIPAPEDLLAAMRVAKFIRVQAISGTPTFEFSLVGAAAAMQRASAICKR